jgi:hypothetical protein
MYQRATGYVDRIVVHCDVAGAQVVIDQSMFRARGSARWVPTRIHTRHIMSWANVRDGHPEKYAPRQISKGDDECWQSAKLREERLTPSTNSSTVKPSLSCTWQFGGPYSNSSADGQLCLS